MLAQARLKKEEAESNARAWGAVDEDGDGGVKRKDGRRGSLVLDESVPFPEKQKGHRNVDNEEDILVEVG